MSRFLNVGVMGHKNSGRTQLKIALSKNLPLMDIVFHKLDISNSDDEISQMLKKLSVLLLLVPESLQLTQIKIIQAARKKIKTAIVITKFDATLLNLDPLTHHFTREQKFMQIQNENNSIAQILKNCNCDSNVPIFHVSSLCFPASIKPGFEECCANEENLCNFLSNSIFSSSITNEQNLCKSIVPAAYKFNNTAPTRPVPIPRITRNFGEMPVQLLTEEQAIEANEHDFLCMYDVAIFSPKNTFVISLEKSLRNIFDEINLKNIAYSGYTDIKKEIGNTVCQLAIILIKDIVDGPTLEVLNHFKSNNVSIAVVIDIENGNYDHFKQILTALISSEMIFALNIGSFNVENVEGKAFCTLVQEKTGKSMKQVIAKKRGITDNFSSKILILGLNEACTTPIFNALKHEGLVKKVEYSVDPKMEDIITEIKAAEITVLVIPSIHLDVYFPLFQELKNQNLNYLLVFDVTDTQISQNYSIEPTRSNISLLSHVHCFNFTPSNEDNNYQFIEAVKKALFKDREKSRKCENSTLL